MVPRSDKDGREEDALVRDEDARSEDDIVHRRGQTFHNVGSLGGAVANLVSNRDGARHVEVFRSYARAKSMASVTL